jgi:hypothetical protein
MNTPMPSTEFSSTITPSTLPSAPDETVVLDDRRIRLQRLQHAADADAAGQVNVAADSARKTATVDHVSTIVPSST